MSIDWYRRTGKRDSESGAADRTAETEREEKRKRTEKRR